MAKTIYYSFERVDGNGYDGLIRFDGVTAEKAIAGSWVVDSTLLERIAAPGADGPEAIDAARAGALAKRYGVEL